MERREFVATSGTIITTLLAGCSGDTDDDDSDDATSDDEEADLGANDEESDVEDEEEDEQETVEEPDPMEFSGSGADVTDEFEIEGGFTAIEATHTGGDSNFQIELIDEDGETAELFVNEIGEFDGEVGASPEGGTYVLDIDADGDWELTLRQPRPTDGDSLSFEESGESPSVLGPYEFDGRVQADGSHDGDGNFIVEAYPAEAGFHELVFNEIDEFEGSNTFSIDELGFVVVQATGPWTLEME